MSEGRRLDCGTVIGVIREPDRTVDSTAPDDPDWVYFTPDEDKMYVIGEGRFATEVEETNTGGAASLKDLKVYQFARSFATIRESYNFNITREDFLSAGSSMGDHFFANADFWNGDQGRGLLDGTFIAAATIGNAAISDLSAGKIQAGTIEAKIEIGGETKVLIDGPNSRIVISD